MPSNYEGPDDNKFGGGGFVESPDPSHPGEAYDLDPALEPNRFPRESYEDGDAMDLTLGT